MRRDLYAWPRLCDREVEFTTHRVELLRIDPAVNHAVAVWTGAAKGAGGLAQGDAFGHIARWHLRGTANGTSEADQKAGPASLVMGLGVYINCLDNAMDHSSLSGGKGLSAHEVGG
jgi:hypothetical protein